MNMPRAVETVVLERRRSRRSLTYTDAIFDQLMEARINSNYYLDASSSGKEGKKNRAPLSSLLTVKNFGSRTGLWWSQERVERELAGLINGFTTQQEDKLALLHGTGRTVVDTISSRTEFDGSGDPAIYPRRSRQQIAAKLLDMFCGENKKDGGRRIALMPTSTPSTAMDVVTATTAGCTDDAEKPSVTATDTTATRSATTVDIPPPASSSPASDGLQLTPGLPAVAATEPASTDTANGTTCASPACSTSAITRPMSPSSAASASLSMVTIGNSTGKKIWPVQSTDGASSTATGSFSPASSTTPRTVPTPTLTEGAPVALVGVAVRPASPDSAASFDRSLSIATSPVNHPPATSSTPEAMQEAPPYSPVHAPPTETSPERRTDPSYFPCSVSSEECASLLSAFGPALTYESWLEGTSTTLDVDAIFNDGTTSCGADALML